MKIFMGEYSVGVAVLTVNQLPSGSDGSTPSPSSNYGERSSIGQSVGLWTQRLRIRTPPFTPTNMAPSSNRLGKCGNSHIFSKWKFMGIVKIQIPTCPPKMAH